MASSSSSALSLALFAIISLALSRQTTLAQSPPRPANLTGILDKNGQYTDFIGLLTTTQLANKIENQLNNSTEGLTVFAPTDNAFANLEAQTIDKLSNEQKVQLVLYHVVPKFYTLTGLTSVRNPVQTEANYGLNFTSLDNQVNVSAGLVETDISNPLYLQSPLAVYQVDEVLLPPELSEASAPASSTPTAASTSSSGSNSASSAKAPAAANNNSAVSGRNMWLGFVVGVGIMCMGVLA